MIKRNLFYFFILAAVGGLVVVSLTTVDKGNAIVAVVESQKTAISYQKAVSIKKIHVISGQQVKIGDLLLEVDRPDLNFDYEKLLNQKIQEESNITGLTSEYQSRIELNNIERDGKISRINAEIAQLELEIELDKSMISDLESINSNSVRSGNKANPDSILLESYRQEKKQIQTHFASERNRLAAELKMDLELVRLKIKLIDDEISLLDNERSQLKKFAPFDGTIGNVNAQLNEIVPSFQTIVSLFEQRPSTLKAFLGSESPFIMNPGDEVDIESANREYSVSGKVIEVGARIVSYRDPSEPIGAPERYGREVFITLPDDNSFLYGEQVFVYPRSK